jgi:hypothetical protein
MESGPSSSSLCQLLHVTTIVSRLCMAIGLPTYKFKLQMLFAWNLLP